MGALGLCLYFNQLFYIIGIDLSGVVVATCMQPTIPVFTAAIAVALHLEAGSAQKFAGIGLAVGGSICMVSGQHRRLRMAVVLGERCLRQGQASRHAPTPHAVGCTRDPRDLQLTQSGTS